MPKKQKAAAARAATLQVARETLSVKRRKSTPVDSDLSGEDDLDGGTDEIAVSFSNQLIMVYISQ